MGAYNGLITHVLLTVSKFMRVKSKKKNSVGLLCKLQLYGEIPDFNDHTKSGGK